MITTAIKRKALAVHTLYVFVFAIYLVASGIFSSLIATSDPSNALTLYLVPLVIISVMCVFELYETLILILAIEAVFTSLLIYSQISPYRAGLQ